MDSRISQVISALENNGWTFDGYADVQSDWWFREMFLFTSTWSPVGINMYLTLLIDPGDPKYKKVWAAGFSREIPDGRHFTYLKLPTLKDLGRIDIEAFVKEVNTLIMSAKT